MKPPILKGSLIAGISIIFLLTALLDALGPEGLALSLAFAAPPSHAPSPAAARMRSQAADAYGRLPMIFEPNQGQATPSVKFLSHGSGFTLHLRAKEAVLAFSAKGRKSEFDRRKGMDETWTGHPVPSGPASLGARLRGWDGLSVRTTRSKPPRQEAGEMLRMQLVGGSPAAKFEGLDPLPGKVNYYMGNDPSRWHTGVPTYAKVRYQGAYPGVDLVYYGNQGELEYDFEVAPGADPTIIRLAIAVEDAAAEAARPGGRRGCLAQDAAARSGRLKIDSHGDLVVRLDRGEVRFRKPVIYQPPNDGGLGSDDEGKQTTADTGFRFHGAKRIEGHYVLRGRHEVGFEIAAYDRSRPLVIDPVLAYSTYTNLNGQGVGAAGIGIDGSGNAYILGGSGAGTTTEAVVLALNPQGNQIVYTTYLSPTGTFGPSAIAVDPQGDAYITGAGAPGFPTTAGAYQATCPSICNTPFAAKFSPTGTLTYATFLGPSNAASDAIAIDPSGDTYITGTIASDDLPAVNAFQPQFAGSLCSGCSNAFVQKLNPTGSQLLYSTYLGGGFGSYGYDTANGSGIAVDSAGSAYVVGVTQSPLFPVKNALQSTQLAYVGGDAFLTKFTPDGSALVYSTYLGGSGGMLYGEAEGDTAVAVAVDASGDAYVTGDAVSPDFPVTMNAFKASCYESALEACVAPQVYLLKVDPNGASLLYSTLIGVGTVANLALDSSGDAWATGTTSSNYFPVLQPIESNLQQNAYPTSNADAFVTRLNSSGMPTFSTYLGGGFSSANGVGVAADNSGNAYVAGSMGVGNDTPIDFPIVNPVPGTQGAAQFYYPGALFAAKISPAAGPAISLSPWYTSILALRDVSSSPLTINSITTSSTLVLEGGTCGSSLPPGGGCMLIVYPQNAQNPASGTLTISSNAPGSPQTFNIGYSQIGTNQVFVSRNNLEFPVQLVGSSSAAQTVTLTNLYYPNPVGITNIEVSPPDPSAGVSGDFTQTSNCPASLAPGASCTITLQYEPTAGTDGPEYGQLQIIIDTAPTNYTIYLTGIRSSESLVTYTQSTQYETFTPSVQFGMQYVGATPLPRVLALTNADVQPITPSGFTVTGPFTQTNNCSGPLASHAGCRVAISFVPTGNSPNVTGTLTVNSGGQGGPLTVNLAATGEILADLGVSPLQLSFGNIVLGESSTLPLTLTNSSSATLTLSAFNLSPNYTQTNDCNGSLAPAATCTVSVTFTPSAPAEQDGTLSIDFSGNGSPQVISLTGAGATALHIIPTSLTFGPQSVGTPSAPQSVDLSNQGAPSITINSINVSGDFQVVSNSCPNPIPLWFACPVLVDFVPTQTGSRTGTLTIMSSDSSTPYLVELSGTGAIMPEVTLTPGSLSFGTQQAGSTSPPQTVTLANTGSATLTITGMAMSGDYAQTNTCGGSVSAGAKCTISITFTPATGGQRNGSLTITDNAADSPQVVTLTGSGTGPAMTLIPSSLSFPATLVGTGAGYEEVLMESSGVGPVTITNVAASGDFSVQNTCPSVLGGSCPVEVGFNPTAAGTRTGTLTFTDNAHDSPQSIPLTGSGTDFTVATAPGSSATQTVSAGQTASYSLALSGTSEFSGSVSLTCSGAPALATCTVNPSAVLLNGTNVLNTTVNVTTTARSMEMPGSRPRGPASRIPAIQILYWLLALAMLGWLTLRSGKRLGLFADGPSQTAYAPQGTRLATALLLLVILGMLAMLSCAGGGGGGGGGNPGTPAGTYTLDVTATFAPVSTTLTHDIKLTLTVN